MKDLCGYIFLLTPLFLWPASVRAGGCSETARELMYEIQRTYREDRGQFLIDMVQQEFTELTPAQEEHLTTTLQDFFASQHFYSTGCRYLDRLFSQKELTDIQELLRHHDHSGTFLRNHTKIGKLLEKLEPLIYHYLRTRALQN
ncbi:hypothetical protein [Chitinivibrio alkaliphilus]|uniref:Uncharacterized protein n=1 Tax=Chitinivibrio alkaliphilus ACht1 TaxID=1313304 RepID=U7DCY4_9BACT|nr:hypothetical protein [Chitinivibrio alkaliphilus]ERP38756.1 hypothetical protein CALK_0775 [Chitinivibrio alkaliphilus ACht1]